MNPRGRKPDRLFKHALRSSGAKSGQRSQQARVCFALRRCRSERRPDFGSNGCEGRESNGSRVASEAADPRLADIGRTRSWRSIPKPITANSTTSPGTAFTQAYRSALGRHASAGGSSERKRQAISHDTSTPLFQLCCTRSNSKSFPSIHIPDEGTGWHCPAYPRDSGWMV